MRLAKTLVLVAIAAWVGAPGAAHAAGPLLGQWSLDGSYEDGASDATADTSGNALHLKAPSGSIHLGPPARFGTAATLPTNTSPMQVTSPLLAPARVTLLAWIKQTGNPGTLKYIAGRGDDALTCGGSSYAIYSGYPAKPGLHFYVRFGPAASALTDAPLDASVFNGQWHLLAGTYDGTAARFYVDGVLVGAPVPAAGPLNYALGGGNSFYVDGYPVDGCNLSPNADDWPGPIDDVRVYDRALSASEIGRIAAAPGPDAPLLITDESLIQPIPVPAVPAPAPPTAPEPPTSPAQPAAEAKVSGALRGADAGEVKEAVAGLAGASKRPPKESLRDALVAAQEQALAAMASASGSSRVGTAQRVKDVSAKEAKLVQPDEQVQGRLGSQRYGIEVKVPTTAPGQIVEAAVTLALEKKSGKDVKIQQVVLPPAVGISGPDGEFATVHIPVDNKATEAMTKEDIASAAMAVQAAKLDAMKEYAIEWLRRIQNQASKAAKTQELLNNVVKKINDTSTAITQNLRGGVSPSEEKEQRDLKSKAAKLEKEAKQAEAERDAANQKATQEMEAAVNALLAGLAPGAAAAGDTATKIPMATAAVTGCKVCKLGAASSN